MSLIHHFDDVNIWIENLDQDHHRDRIGEIARFERFYAAGTKLWTRKLLASIADQIDAANAAYRKHGVLTEEHGVVVRVPDILGGNNWDFSVRLGEVTGDAWEAGGEHYVYVSCLIFILNPGREGFAS